MKYKILTGGLIIGLVALNLAMASYGVQQFKKYESTILTLQTSREGAMIRYKAELNVVEADKEEALELLRNSNKNLNLLYTFAKTGIKAETLEDVKRILALASNLPFGSPFKTDFIVTSSFGGRDESAYGGDNNHSGIDIVPSSGNSRAIIYTTAKGKIIEFGVSDTYGKYIIFETEFGYRLKYAHLSKIFYQDEDGKVTGIQLQQGMKLGVIGNTGFSFGVHLHFEVHIWDDTTEEYLQLDPEEILKFID